MASATQTPEGIVVFVDNEDKQLIHDFMTHNPILGEMTPEEIVAYISWAYALGYRRSYLDSSDLMRMVHKNLSINPTPHFGLEP